MLAERGGHLGWRYVSYLRYASVNLGVLFAVRGIIHWENVHSTTEPKL